MKKKFLKIQKLLFIFFMLLCFIFKVSAQYKTYQLTETGDTLNAVDKNNHKQGKWIVRVAALRGEPGYEDEGTYKTDNKEGKWKRYNLHNDLIAVENYLHGGKDGVQQYYTMLGDLVKEESWRAYNPDAPYDTIAIYSNTDNNAIKDYKIVKAEPYSVRDGEWKYYDPSTGRVIKTEVYERNAIRKDPEPVVAEGPPKKKVKPQEVLDYEKKNSGKKKVKLREGQTGY